MCSSLPSGCYLLKTGVQRLMDSREILFEKTLIPTVPCEDISIITIFANPSKVSSRRPIRIILAPRVAPLIITFPGLIPYASDKAVPRHYAVDVYYHGVKQDLKNEEVDTNIRNIVGTSKITRSGRVFSPEISPRTVNKPVVISPAIPIDTSTTTYVLTPIVTPAIESSGTRGKEAIG